MSVYTVEECHEQLAKWKAASIAVSNSKSYTIGGRTLTRANWSEIKDALTYWGRELANAEAAAGKRRSGVRMRRVVLHG